MKDFLRSPESVKKSVEKIIKRLVQDSDLPYYKRHPRRIQVMRWAFVFNPTSITRRYRLERHYIKKNLISHYGMLPFRQGFFYLDDKSVDFVTGLIMESLKRVYEKHAEELINT